MTALTIHNISLSQKVATELLALAPDVPPVMTDDDVVTAISSVLAAHGDDLAMCLADLAYAYGDHPDEVASRMARATVYTARLCGVRL